MADRGPGAGLLAALAVGAVFAFAVDDDLGGFGGPGGPEPLARSAPVHLSIEEIGVDAPLVRLGLNPDGTLQDPPLEEAGLAGWYSLGAAPGEAGPAVITGHLDTRTGPSVFLRLGELRRGDTVRVRRADGSEPEFTVQRVERVAKEDFPAEQVYGPVDHPALRLITCGGEFDRATGHYSENTVVYARMSDPGR
ncbi:class F sortase [Actinorugispora endophytica]|uniref:LPXTG-site transpeptidase (Sortase) family protein n=1 Tax=Actinorugispora endophytica TaxID=1605990 RepID=A0A4R6V7R5_9ACTN|nr:class F sortase [Actinorugispora endophytica]TDQ52376.1 LPXTG-site transpeptidase (sortase) family protein [Actinorugispora endophytica]